MTVDHSFHIGAGLVDFTVNEPFQNAGATLWINGIEVEIVFHDICGGD